MGSSGPTYHCLVLQGQEIFIILLLALVVFGPQRLPEMARKLGEWTSELRKAAREIRQGLEAEVGEVKAIEKEIVSPIKDAKKALTDTTRLADVNPLKWTGPPPPTGPTPDDAAADLNEITTTGEAVTDEPES